MKLPELKDSQLRSIEMLKSYKQNELPIFFEKNNRKSVKILGYLVYEKDSITTPCSFYIWLSAQSAGNRIKPKKWI